MGEGETRDGAGAHALVVGEALVDVVHRDGATTEYPGGSAANVALALARLERGVRFATSLGDDPRGRRIAEHLGADGVVLAGDAFVLDHTSVAEATIGADGSASYVFDLTWRVAGGADAEPQPVVVHTSSLAAVLEPGAGEVRDLLARLRAGATVTYDINARPAVTGTGAEVVAQVERMAALADLVRCSDEDLEHLYADLDEAGAAERLLATGAVGVVVTRGGSGAVWYAADGVVEVTAPRVEVADTIGAGDTFGAGVIDALWERGRLGGRLPALDAGERAAVLAHAARAAAVTVSRPGADPPYRHELEG